MKLLYHFLFEPARIIQLFNHQKDWRLWWGLIGINSLISVVKLSSLDLFSIVTHGIVILTWLVLTAIIIDASAQLIGLNAQLPSVIYWLAFASSVLWLSPSMDIIQNTFYSLGSILIFLLNIIFLIYVWKTLQKIYACSFWKLIGIFIVPCLSVIIVVISLVVYGTQLAMTIK